MKTHGISLDRFFAGEPNTANDRDRSFLKATIEGGVRVRKEEVVHINGFSSDLDCEVCKNADIQKVIDDNAGEVTITVPIKNTDRSVGAMLSGNIARAHGNNGFKGQISVQFEGSAGPSFGAFTLPGLKLHLVGDGNDYVPSPDAGFVTGGSSIVGNACLYGATGGDFYANGRAGERFGVRNSGRSRSP